MGTATSTDQETCSVVDASEGKAVAVTVNDSVMEGLAVGVKVRMGVAVTTASRVAESVGGGGVSVSVGLDRFSGIEVEVDSTAVAASMNAVEFVLVSRNVSEGESTTEGLFPLDRLPILSGGVPEASLVVAPSGISLGSELIFSSLLIFPVTGIIVYA